MGEKHEAGTLGIDGENIYPQLTQTVDGSNGRTAAEYTIALAHYLHIFLNGSLWRNRHERNRFFYVFG